MTEDVYEDLNDNFEKAYSALQRDLKRIRTGRANANLLDTIRVDYYGQPTPLNQVAAVQIPEARMITIKPWESHLLKEIERAIQQSDLGLNPSNDGTLIRLSIPQLTEDRRKQLARKVRELGEEGKIRVRNARRDANTLLKELEKDGDLTEDDLKRTLKVVQDRTDKAIAKVDTIIASKEQELLDV